MIEKALTRKLCTSCGTCAGVCPNDAIKIFEELGFFRPVVDTTKCNKCGICLRVCPGKSVNFTQLNESFFGRTPSNSLLGNLINCYLGYSIDDNLHWGASSGGLVTSLLIFMIKKGLIDGAVVVKMDLNGGGLPRPRMFIARNEEELLSSRGSKYALVPINVGLKEIIKEDGRFAVIGLPCHLHGIRKAELIFNKLAKRIFLHIGLFCGHTTNFLGTQLILERMGVKTCVELSYRGKGWPGGLYVKLKDGKEKTIPFKTYYAMFSLNFFTPIRCLLCCDQTAELSDISFGDAWLPELKSEKKRASLVITRKKVGEDMLQFAQRNGIIKISRSGYDKVLLSEASGLFFKKYSLKARASFLKSLGYELPYYISDSPKSGILAFSTLISCINALTSRYLYGLLKYTPYKLFNLCASAQGEILRESFFSYIKNHYSCQ